MWSMILSDKVVGIKKRYMKNVAAPDTQIVDLLQLKQYYAVIVPFKVKTYFFYNRRGKSGNPPICDNPDHKSSLDEVPTMSFTNKYILRRNLV